MQTHIFIYIPILWVDRPYEIPITQQATSPPVSNVSMQKHKVIYYQNAQHVLVFSIFVKFRQSVEQSLLDLKYIAI